MYLMIDSFNSGFKKSAGPTSGIKLMLQDQWFSSDINFAFNDVLLIVLAERLAEIL